MKQMLENASEKLKEVLNLRSWPVIGIDIDPKTVKMVRLCQKNGEGYYVTSAVMRNIEQTEGSKYPSQSAVIAAIKECWKSSEGSISEDCYFVFGLSGPKVKISSFSFPSLTLDEVGPAVMFEASQVCPFDMRNSVVDYQLIGLDESNDGIFVKNKISRKVKGFLAVAAKEEISRKQRLAESAMLKCVLMDSDGLALLNCLKECLGEDKNRPIACINVGMSSVTVAILGADGSPFIRDLRNCGSDIIKHIAKGRGVGVDQVLDEICGGDGIGGEQLVDIEPACRRLVRDINETFAYYSAHHGNDAVRCVYVCGDFLLLKDFEGILGDSIDGKVSIWNPFLHMNCDDIVVGSELVGKGGPALAVAAGLAMRQV